MKTMTFIWPPHWGQAKGAISYNRLMSMAQVWLQRLVMETGEALPQDDVRLLCRDRNRLVG